MSSRWLSLGSTLIQLIGGLVVAYHTLVALNFILRRQGSDRARIVIADGVLAALGFMVAGTLLNTLALQTWVQIRAFALIFALRTMLKQVFASEKKAVERRVLPHSG